MAVPESSPKATQDQQSLRVEISQRQCLRLRVRSGADFAVTERIAIRIVVADYGLTRFGNNFTGGSQPKQLPLSDRCPVPVLGSNGNRLSLARGPSRVAGPRRKPRCSSGPSTTQLQLTCRKRQLPVIALGLSCGPSRQEWRPVVRCVTLAAFREILSGEVAGKPE